MGTINASVSAIFSWDRSAICGNGANCVEVAEGPRGVAVRDSKDPHGAVLWFTPEEWTAFLAGVRTGQFDLVTETNTPATGTYSYSP